LSSVAARFPRVHLPKIVLDGYRQPPRSPEECTFAKLTNCLSADLTTRVTPCQLGGRPVCEECGCIASAGMHALASFKIGGLIPLSAILNASLRVGGERTPERQAGLAAGGLPVLNRKTGAGV